MNNQDFIEGFEFALKILRAKNGCYLFAEFEAEVAYLESIVNGDITLLPSPDENVDKTAKIAGKEFANMLRKAYSGESRRKIDAENRAKAKIILDDILIDPELD